jgi:queuine tRNA-ribosyltransferase
MEEFSFEVTARDGRARLGRMTTAHGTVETPAFMPVGTAGAVKAVTPRELRVCGAQIVLSNTYHLFLRPGHDSIRELGGLHEFMQWRGPILTDSGGFQIFSLAALSSVEDDGVSFRSHLDGSQQLLTPESSMEIQSALGSDIAMVLDECPPWPAPRDQVEKAVARTTAWAGRCRNAYAGPGVAFGIVQGGTFEDLRRTSAEQLIALDFPGYAIGGVSVGEPPEAVLETVSFTAELLPRGKPRYLMGMGRPRDLVEAVAEGADIFDCVMPTRNARNGSLFTSTGKINIKRAEYQRDRRPLDDSCRCEACTGYSRAYLRHLFVSGEIQAARLHSIHNLTYYLGLMKRIRRAIEEGRIAAFRREYLDSLEERGDER